jgi:hypothetical protein
VYFVLIDVCGGRVKSGEGKGVMSGGESWRRGRDRETARFGFLFQSMTAGRKTELRKGNSNKEPR